LLEARNEQQETTAMCTLYSQVKGQAEICANKRDYDTAGNLLPQPAIFPGTRAARIISRRLPLFPAARFSSRRKSVFRSG
jgi:hypothetical protein